MENEKLRDPIVELKKDYLLEINKSVTNPNYFIRCYKDSKLIFILKNNKYPLDDVTLKNKLASELVSYSVYENKELARKELSKAYIKLRPLLDDWVNHEKLELKELELIKEKQKECVYNYNITNKISIQNLKMEIEKEFPMMSDPLEACISIINTLLLEDLSDPMSINLIGAPSSEKTTILGFFYGLDDIIFRTDNFSPKSFVSHSNISKEELEEVDLLPKIKDKCFILPELAPIFGKRKEDLTENMSVITRVFDGEGYESDSGVHGHRGYRGEYMFAWLGGSTPLSNAIWRVMGKLGNRFMFYDIPAKNKTKEDLINTLSSETSYKQKKERCRIIVNNFMQDLFSKYKKPYSVKWDKSKDEKEALEFIILLAKLLTKLRATIDIFEQKDDEGTTHFSYQIPLVEEPERAIQMLYNISRGRAIAYERNYIKLEDIPLIYKIAISSCPYDRAKVIQIFFKNNLTRTDSKEIAGLLNCSDRHAKRIMEQFRILGIVKESKLMEEKDNQGRPKNIYELDQDIQNLLQKTQKLINNLDSVLCRNEVQKEDENEKNINFGHESDTTHPIKKCLKCDLPLVNGLCPICDEEASNG